MGEARAIKMQAAGGLPSMLKHGATHAEGVQDAIIRNLEACEALTTITRTSLGPNGMNKLVQNHIGKTYVTSDCATMLAQMDVQHPAAKMLCLATKTTALQLIVNTASDILR